MSTNDKHLPDFWKSVKPGDIVHLTDLRTLDLSQKAGKGLNGTDYQVSKVVRIREQDDLAEWRILHLDLPEDSVREDLRIVVKIVDENVSIGALEPLGVESGTREELLDRDSLWLFEEPSNPDDFSPDELRFAAELVPNETGETFGWFRKPQGEMYGECDYFPQRSGMSKDFVVVVEYGGRMHRKSENAEWEEVEDDEEFHEIYILQTGKGGYVELMGCWNLSFGDIAVMRR